MSDSLLSSYLSIPFRTDGGAIGADCAKNTSNSETSLECTANSKLDQNENCKVTGHFDVSRARLIPNKNMDSMKTSVKVLSLSALLV